MLKDAVIDKRKMSQREREDKGRMKVFFKSGNVILNEAKEYIAGVSAIDLAVCSLLLGSSMGC